MDVVYLLSNTVSDWHNYEIKFSLRSVEKHLKNFNKVFVIGAKPPFLNDKVIRIPHHDESSYGHERNIYEKIKFACLQPEISDEFLFFNDDYFLLQDIDALTVPDYWDYTLRKKLENRKYTDEYWRSLSNTIKALNKLGKEYPIKNFDIHYPIIYSKKLFLEVMSKYDWTVPDGYVIKSLYCNTLRRIGHRRKDGKIHKNYSPVELREKLKELDLFSTKPGIADGLKQFIVQKFPNKSSYEV